MPSGIPSWLVWHVFCQLRHLVHLFHTVHHVVRFFHSGLDMPFLAIIKGEPDGNTGKSVVLLLLLLNPIFEKPVQLLCAIDAFG
jgi:hypothetical protein